MAGNSRSIDIFHGDGSVVDAADVVVHAGGGGDVMSVPLAAFPLLLGGGESGISPFSLRFASGHRPRERRKGGQSRSKEATEIMAALVRCGPIIGEIAGKVQPGELAKRRRLALCELQCLKLTQRWLECRGEEGSVAWSYFQKLAPYVGDFLCDGINVFGVLTFHVSGLLSELRVPFGRRRDGRRSGPELDVDKMKLRLFSASCYLEEFLKERGCGSKCREALEKIEQIDREIKSALGWISRKERKLYASQLEEMQAILRLLCEGLRNGALLPILLQPVVYQCRIVHQYLREREDEKEEDFSCFFEKLVSELLYLSEMFSREAQNEKEVMYRAIKKRRGIREVRAWQEEFEMFIRDFGNYMIKPLKGFQKEIYELNLERKVLFHGVPDTNFVKRLERRAKNYRRLILQFDVLLDRIDEVFKPAEKIPLFSKRMEPLFREEALLRQCPLFALIEPHWDAWIGRPLYRFQMMRQALGFEEKKWTRIHKGFALRVEFLFSEKPLVCASKHVSEFNLISGEMRALILDLSHHVPSTDHGKIIDLFRMFNCMEEVFCDIARLEKDVMEDEEERCLLSIYQSVLGNCLTQGLPSLEQCADERGRQIIGQLKKVLIALQKAPFSYEGTSPKIMLLSSFTCTRSSHFELDEKSCAFFKRELRTCLWLLRRWNRVPFEVDEISPALLAALPFFIRFEMSTYVNELNHTIRRFRSSLAELERNMATQPLNTKEDLLEMANLMSQREDALQQFDFHSLLEEISFLFLRYRQQAGREAPLYDIYDRISTYFMQTIFDQVMELEGFYLSTFFFPLQPFNRWAQFERFIRGEGAARLGEEHQRAPRIELSSSEEDEPLTAEPIAEGEGGAAAPVASDERGGSFSEFYYLLTRWLRSQEDILAGNGGGAHPSEDAVRTFNQRNELTQNMKLYLETLAEWTTSRRELPPCPPSFVKWILLDGALMVEQTLKLLIVQALGRLPPHLLEGHPSIAQLLQAYPHSSRLSEEESLHLIILGRFITVGSRSLKNTSNPQVKLMRRVLRLQGQYDPRREEEGLRLQIFLCLERAREDVAKAFQSLAKLCGADLSALIGRSLVPDVEVREVAEMEPRECDRRFQAHVEQQLGRIEAAIARGRAVGSGNGIEKGMHSLKVQRKRKGVIQESEDMILTAKEVLKTTVLALYQPESSFTLSCSALFESCLIFDGAVKSLMAMHAMGQSTNPDDHFLWERNPRNGRLYLHEHRLSDLFAVVQRYLNDGSISLSEEQERTLRLLNDFIGSSRYLGAHTGGVANPLKRVAFLSRCFRQLQAGWSLPEQEDLVRILGGERDRMKWPAMIQAEINRILEEMVYPLISHLLEAATTLIEYQSAKRKVLVRIHVAERAAQFGVA